MVIAEDTDRTVDESPHSPSKLSMVVVYIFLLIMLFVVFRINWSMNAYWKNTRYLANELCSPIESPQEWAMQKSNPMQYRLLFYWIVHTSWTFFYDESDAKGFLTVYRFWSALFFYLCLIVLYDYLRLLEFDQKSAVWGCLIFLSSPPVMFAYVYPVHTREDPLAYLLILLVLISILKQKVWSVVVFAILGVLCRETLLIVPLVYLVFSEDKISNRLFVFVVSLFTFMCIRIIVGIESYNPFDSARENYEYPFETILALFLVFGFYWVPGLSGLFMAWSKRKRLPAEKAFILSSAWLSFLLIMGSHIFLARARELRISFLVFPWLIPFVLDWFNLTISRFKRMDSSKLGKRHKGLLFTPLPCEKHFSGAKSLLIFRSLQRYGIHILIMVSLMLLFYSFYMELKSKGLILESILYTYSPEYWLKIALVHILITTIILYLIFLERYIRR